MPATATTSERATRAQIDEFLSQPRFAVVGVSRNPQDISRSLMREFRSRGKEVVPVNPSATELEGQRCWARVQEIEPPVSAALLFTSPAVTEQVVRDCQAAGITQIWMYRGGGAGAVSSSAVAFCREYNMKVIAGECPFMFLANSMWFHRMHGLVRKLLGTYPR